MRCAGCLQEFCYNHSSDHRQELNKQFDKVEVSRNLFRQKLTQQTIDPQKHPLIQQINDWERQSIKKIRQTAEEARQILLQHTIGHITKIEIDLNKLTNQLKQSREKNDFYETELHHWNEELKQLEKELNKPSNIHLREDSRLLINKISVDVRSVLLSMPNIGANAKWIQNGITIAGGNGYGNDVSQLNSPFGLYIDDDDDQTIYIADQCNHRIVKWKSGATNGQVVAGESGQGNRNDQLNYPLDVIVDKENDSLIICDSGNKRVVRWPLRNGTSGEIIISNVDCRGLAIDNDGYLYVSDVSKHEVRRWKIGDTNGTIIAGGNGKGDRLDQFNGPYNIFVDQDHSVYVSDRDNHRVIKWAKDAREGIIVAGDQGQGNSLTQLSNPRGIVVDQLGTVYVADCDNHRVMRWSKGATQGSIVIGRNRREGQANQLHYPVGLSFDQQSNLYVVDKGNHCIQKFNFDPNSCL
ncbi:unnamed protein product [Rotaria sordida]|uniref:Uncharacterized protein n=1 Tax=Rotaria sordida TaxID=392033 RepID=A0A814W0I8_9BILA|nr:unnamed protein product [Rotaria sordida]CAF1197620.1 unnamed protein product [Rotaria sordida]CAF1431977.1 unnamed protein product [Rotaria sordida]